ALRLVHGAGPVILPSTFVNQITCRILARDPVVHATPPAAVHGMDKPTHRVLPAGYTFMVKRVRGKPAEGKLPFLPVRVPGPRQRPPTGKQRRYAVHSVNGALPYPSF